MMAQSTGIVLTATGISFANEWIQNNDANVRIIVAGLGVALVFAGIEQVNAQVAVGLSYLMLITALLTPIKGKSPADTLVDWTEGKVH